MNTVYADETVSRFGEFLHSPKRLASVRGTQLLDSGPEECFDSLTRLACVSLDVPLSYFTLLDADRDYFKSLWGFPEPLATSRTLTEERTFCHYAAISGKLLAIEDTLGYEQWARISSVRNSGVRAFLGMPITLNGQRVGNFCVADLTPRLWTERDRETVIQLALSAQRELSLRSALVKANFLAQQAEKLVQSKEELIAVIAHDLRTPLQTFSLTLALLQRTGITENEAAHSRASNAVLAMGRIVDELLVNENPEVQTPYAHVPLSTKKIAEMTVQLMTPIAERKHIRLVLGESADAVIMGDLGQMLRVFSNIIGNAIKYSPSASKVSFSCTVEQDSAVFSVIDEGPGIVASEQQRIFERGWQSNFDSPRGESKGHGLGLAIVKQIVEQHRGNVTVHSAVGEGSRFSVKIPILHPSPLA